MSSAAFPIRSDTRTAPYVFSDDGLEGGLVRIELPAKIMDYEVDYIEGVFALLMKQARARQTESPT